MNYQVLVNKENVLDRDYVPSDLVEYTEYNGVKLDPTIKTYVDRTTLEAFYKMNEDAKKVGYYFIVDSAYRPYTYQEKILRDNIEKYGNEAYYKVALPGTSEHQTGLAIDVALQRNGVYTDEFTEKDEEIVWLEQNAYKYGFILRYPDSYQDITGFKYECWHYRYVGVELSTYMHDNDIKTLEEYYMLNKLKTKKRIKN